MSMTELVRETDLSIFLRGMGVSFLSSASVPVCESNRFVECIDSGVASAYSVNKIYTAI